MKNDKTIYMLCWDIVGCVCEMRVDDLFVDRTSGNSSVAINRLLASSGTHTLSCFIFKPDFNNGKTTHNTITNITNANINVHLEVCSLTLDTNKGEFIDSHTVLSTDINSSKQKMVFDFSVELPYKLDLANNAQIIIARKNNDFYDFTFIDDYGNKCFGHISFKEMYVDLFFDCYEYSEIGKNFRRLYGNCYELTKYAN